MFLLVPTLLGVSIFVFMAVRFLPGDAIDQMFSDYIRSPDPEARAALEERFQLNRSIPLQYVEWVGGIVRGDLGDSFLTRRPVTSDLKNRLVLSLELGTLGMLFSIAIALPIGIMSAVRQDSWLDYIGRSFAIALLAVPSFWLALMALVYGLEWFGWVPPLQYRHPWDEPLTNLEIMWMPALILGGGLAGAVMRFTRSAMLDVLRQDYVRTARAKGLNERNVLIRHALRNALLPVVTLLGLQVGVLVGGTVILERIFSLPGMGNYLLNSLGNRDYPPVQAIVLLSAAVVITSNLVVDVLYAVIDPRIRYS